METFGRTREALERSGAALTAREISQQPSLWPRIGEQHAAHRSTQRAFLDPLLARPDLRIVLTGAGTSACVGECLAPALTRRLGRTVEALATTDLVAAPDRWLSPATPTLLVSFARSGNSPESVAAVDLASRLLPECHHLIVTCNRDGALHARGGRDAHVILLPEETNDRGFAMTSSFTGMLLATALAFDLLPPARAAALAAWASHMLKDFAVPSRLAAEGFERVVYLGSNEFKGLAHEAALKLLELSDGRVVAVGDTPLGFRHGPKTILNRRTLVVVFVGNDPYSRRYDLDMLRELRADGIAGHVLALRTDEDPASGGAVGIAGAAGASDLELCFPYVVFAQSLALLQSLALGLRPDSPNAAGVVNRVVQGVSIHPWQPGA